MAKGHSYCMVVFSIELREKWWHFNKHVVVSKGGWECDACP